MTDQRKFRACHFCGTVTETWCPTCIDAFPHRRAVEGMTREEKLAEFDRWSGPLEVPFSLFHERMTELLGRDVWTHEFAEMESLRREIETGEVVENPVERAMEHLQQTRARLGQPMPEVIWIAVDREDSP